MVSRASRLGRNSSGNGGAYGVFLIFAGLVAGAVVAKRRSRRELAIALPGEDAPIESATVSKLDLASPNLDFGERGRLRPPPLRVLPSEPVPADREAHPADGLAPKPEPVAQPEVDLETEQVEPAQEAEAEPETKQAEPASAPAPDIPSEIDPPIILPSAGDRPDLPVRPVRREMPPDLLPPRIEQLDQIPAPEPAPAAPGRAPAEPDGPPTEVESPEEADPFAWPSAAEVARSQAPARPAETGNAPRQPQPPAQTSDTPPGATDSGEGFQSLIDFASSHEPILPTLKPSEPVDDLDAIVDADTTVQMDHPPLAARPPQAGTDPAAEQSPWPDLPVPPVTRSAALITPPDGLDPATADHANSPARIEQPLRARPPAAPSAETPLVDATATIEFMPQADLDQAAATLNQAATAEGQPPSERVAMANRPAPVGPSHAGKSSKIRRQRRGGNAGTPPAVPEDDGIFYGWIVVGAVFVILSMSSGLGFYNASVILAAATNELNTSVGAASGATGLFFAISGLTGFAFAKQMDSVDLRWFFAIGGLIGAIALVGLQWVTSVVGLYIFFAVFGIGFALAGLVPGTTVVTRWFDRRRSVALSIASTGLSVGGIVISPIAAWLIKNRELAGASPYMAAMWIVGIVPIALLLIRSYPSDKGLVPDGAAPTQSGATPATAGEATSADAGGISSMTGHTEDQTSADAGGSTKESKAGLAGLDFLSARSTRFFIALCVAYSVIFFGQVGAIAQLFKMVLERSDSSFVASLALAVLAGSSVVARLIGGAVVAKTDTRHFTAILAVMQALALALLAIAPSPLTLVIGSAFFGISIGNLLMLQPLLLAEAFGVKQYGRIYSFNQLIGTLGVAGGPFILGVLRDVADYRVAFLVAAAASLTGFAFVVLAGPTERVQSRWSTEAAAAP